MATSIDNIERALAVYNGRETATLEALLSEGAVDGMAVQHLVNRIPSYDANAEVGATWLLLEALKSGSRFNAPTQAACLDAMTQLKRWESKLHMARAVEFLALSDAQAESVSEILRSWASDSAAFLRAWSVTALVQLAKRHPALETAADAALARAKNDPAASVRARLRRLGLK